MAASWPCVEIRSLASEKQAAAILAVNRRSGPLRAGLGVLDIGTAPVRPCGHALDQTRTDAAGVVVCTGCGESTYLRRV